MSTTSPLVVIVGASGRLGSAAAIGFLSNGYHVVGIDRLASSDGAFPILSVNAIDESSVPDDFRSDSQRVRRTTRCHPDCRYVGYGSVCRDNIERLETADRC